MQPNPGWAGFHKCPIEGCAARIRDGKVLCGRHWKMLTHRFALDLWRAARDRGVESPQYLAIRGAAVAFVTEREKSERKI